MLKCPKTRPSVDFNLRDLESEERFSSVDFDNLRDLGSEERVSLADITFKAPGRSLPNEIRQVQVQKSQFRAGSSCIAPAY